jgi:hypothetical protein
MQKKALVIIDIQNDITKNYKGSLYFGCHTSLVAPKLVLGFLPTSLL